MRRMRFAYWISKATDTRSEYIRLTAFPRQQWLREGVSILCLYLCGPSCLHSRSLRQDLKILYSISKRQIMKGNTIIYASNMLYKKSDTFTKKVLCFCMPCACLLYELTYNDEVVLSIAFSLRGRLATDVRM
jgi:hypothetical protein